MTPPDVPVSGACAIPASENLSDYRLDDNAQLHKAGLFSASVGRETGMAAAVRFTLFLLLMQVNGASARQCPRKAAAFLPPEGATTQGLRGTTLKTNVAPDDDSGMTPPDVPVSGACAIPASENLSDYRLDDNAQLHKAGLFSASVGRETGMAAAVRFTLFLLLMQVSHTEPPFLLPFFLPVSPQKLFDCILSHSCTQYRSRKQFRLLRRFSFYFLLLLICGDVEVNPGPSTEATLQQLLAGQSIIKDKLNAIETVQAANKLAINDLGDRIKSLETKFTNLDEIKSSLAECVVQCETQARVLKSLTSKVDDLENRSRRCNLIFHGIPDEGANETNAECEKQILDICSSKLGIPTIGIERAHRLGRFRAGRSRPIIAKFSSFKEKQQVLGNARKLKGTTTSISEDFSEAVRKKRKILWEYAKAQKQDGAKAMLRYDYLLLNGQKFVCDDATMHVTPQK
nr:uncharacterized protein LOC119169097 [Rhipicephalus microplus]